ECFWPSLSCSSAPSPTRARAAGCEVNARSVAVPTMVVAQLLIAAAVLGTPDVVAASDFLRGGYPTGETVTAACTLVLWVALVVAVAVQAAGLVRQAARRLARPRVR